ncbi:MAG: hypothetical protein RRY26_04510 [Cellulosilyticaceae bacterium]
MAKKTIERVESIGIRLFHPENMASSRGGRTSPSISARTGIKAKRKENAMIERKIQPLAIR